MAAIRVLLLVLFLNLLNSAIAAVPGPYSLHLTGEVEQLFPDPPLDTQILNLIADKQSGNISKGFDPNTSYFPGQDVPGSLMLCECMNKVSLQYLQVCADISIILSKHRIAFTFHSFP